MEKQSILDLSKEELSEVIKPSFRAKQIYQWLYQKYVTSFDEMKNLPKELKAQLEENYYLDPLYTLQKNMKKEKFETLFQLIREANEILSSQKK